MEKVIGSRGVKVLECINPVKGKWAARWAIAEREDGMVEYNEEILFQRPSVDGLAGLLDQEGTVGELRVMADILGEDCTESARKMVAARINSYDSRDVNVFFLGGSPMWLNKDTRVGLMNSINIEKTAGRETTSLWFSGMQFTLPIDLAIGMLNAVELYALECYNVTQEHLAELEKLTIDELENYNESKDYPEKLVFNL